jgi:hypothetical protein
VSAAEVALLYSELWNEYIAENPALIEVLTSASVRRVPPTRSRLLGDRALAHPRDLLP